MTDVSVRSGWSEILEALPVPAVVLDQHGRYLLLNGACRLDPLLAAGTVGEEMGVPDAGSPELHERLLRRQRYAKTALSTGQARYFWETPAANGAAAKHLWVCVPIAAPEGPQLVMFGHISALDEDDSEAALGVTQLLINQLFKELRAPLAAVVGLAGSLVAELSGEQQARARLIDRSGQQLLHRLSELAEQTDLPP